MCRASGRWKVLGRHGAAGSPHEPGRFIGSDGYEGKVDGSKQAANLLEDWAVSGVPREPDAVMRTLDTIAAPERLPSVRQRPGTPMLHAALLVSDAVRMLYAALRSPDGLPDASSDARQAQRVKPEGGVTQPQVWNPRACSGLNWCHQNADGRLVANRQSAQACIWAY